MKFMGIVFFALFATANTAWAQTSEPTDPPSAVDYSTDAATMSPNQGTSTATTGVDLEQIAGLTIEECRDQLATCLERLGTEDEARFELLRQLAERMGFRSVDDMLAQDCRQRRGTWSGGQCTCAEPNHWFSTTERPEQCCVANTNSYSRRQESCDSSGGTYSCRGGCNCPFGMELTDEGECQGERATRVEVADLRARNGELQTENANLRSQIAALQAERDQLQDDLEAARTRGDGLETRVAELESQLRETNSRLENLRTVLIQCEDEDVRQAAAAIPPPPPLPPPGETIPGAQESAAAVAADSARQDELMPEDDAEPAEPSEEEEGWYCTRGAWEGFVCFGLPVLGATAIALGAACAADWCRPTEIVQ